MINFIRKNLLIILLALLAGFLSFFWFVLRERGLPGPSPTPAPTEVKPPSSEFFLTSQGKITLSLSSSVLDLFPKEVPVFEIEKFKENEVLQHASGLVLGLGFTNQPQAVTRPSGTFFVWREGENYLAVNQAAGRFSFSGTVSVTSSLTAATAKQVINNLLASWNIFSGEAESEVLGFITAGLELEPARNLALADVFIIRLTPKISGYKVFGLGSTDPVIEAKITKDGTLLSLIVNTSQTGQSRILPTKSAAEAAREVVGGKAKILKTVDQQGNTFYPTGEDGVESANITNIELVFLEIPEEQQFLFPFFLFSGQGKTISRTNILVFYVVPAI